MFTQSFYFLGGKMMRKIVAVAFLFVFCFGLTIVSTASDYSVLRPAGFDDPDVKAIHSKHKNKDIKQSPTRHEQLLGPAGIIDTLTWRDQDAPGSRVNFGFLNAGDSMLVWLDPPAACSLVAIRFQPLNWEGNMLLDIWNAKNFPPIYSQDSTDASGWLGTYEPITSAAGWVPGDIVGHSPLGGSALDPTHHYWGPFPYTVTPTHANVWIEVPAAAGLQGEVDLGREPFYIGGSFFITQGWGFWSQDPYPGSVPYSFFKFYSAGTGPDATHDGWFIRSYIMWFETVIRFYENTPPTTDRLDAQNWTYGPGPYPITAVITDLDAEDPNQAGVVGAELVYDVNGDVARLPMEVVEGDTFVATIPALNVGDVVTYWIEATDGPGLTGNSSKLTFGRIQPTNPGADLLVIWDYQNQEDLDTFFVDLFDLVENGEGEKYTFELWNLTARNGIDASVIDYGWSTIYISGWGSSNTLPGFEYEGNPFVEWLDNGTPERRNLVLVDQDYFCALVDDYGCEWDEELIEDDFMYDYFDILLAVSDNHGADEGGYDSVAIGQDGTEFAGLRLNFDPTHWWPASGATTPPEGALWPDWIVDLGGEAEQILYYQDHPDFGAGVRLDRGTYRTCFLPWADFFAVDSLENGDLVPREGLVQIIEKVLEWFGTGTDVSPTGGEARIPTTYQLSQNYPNPFNPETKINYQLPNDGWVSLTVYNVLGQEVRTLVAGEKAAGTYTVTWDGRDDSGLSAASGVYFYRLNVGDFTSTKRMILMR